jgi:hypothetical protein
VISAPKPAPRKRKLRKRIARRPKRTTLRRKADALFSLYVRRGGLCERCGAIEGLQCSHYISRRYLAVRYNPLNAECLCMRCHKYLTEHPLQAEDRFSLRVGVLVREELRRVAIAGGVPDYAAVIADLMEKLGSKSVQT